MKTTKEQKQKELSELWRQVKEFRHHRENVEDMLEKLYYRIDDVTEEVKEA